MCVRASVCMCVCERESVYVCARARVCVLKKEESCFDGCVGWGGVEMGVEGCCRSLRAGYFGSVCWQAGLTQCRRAAGRLAR